jgi:hypothetical protein
MIDLSYFKFRVCGGLGGTPRNTSTKLLFSLCFIYYDICFLILFLFYFCVKFRVCEKVGGLGGTPRNTGSSYCFLFALFIMIFASVFLISSFYIFSFFIFIFHFIILLCNRDYNSSNICSPITSD